MRGSPTGYAGQARPGFKWGPHHRLINVGVSTWQTRGLVMGRVFKCCQALTV